MPESGDGKAFSPFGGGKGKGKGKGGSPFGGMGGLLAGIGAGSQLKKTVVKVREKIEVKKTGAGVEMYPPSCRPCAYCCPCHQLTRKPSRP
jgi:hypothetical protein